VPFGVIGTRIEWACQIFQYYNAKRPSPEQNRNAAKKWQRPKKREIVAESVTSAAATQTTWLQTFPRPLSGRTVRIYSMLRISERAERNPPRAFNWSQRRVKRPQPRLSSCGFCSSVESREASVSNNGCRRMKRFVAVS
jgi:hypothetical protein